MTDETFMRIGEGCWLILAEIAVEIVVTVRDEEGTSVKPNGNTVAGPLIQQLLTYRWQASK